MRPSSYLLTSRLARDGRKRCFRPLKKNMTKEQQSQLSTLDSHYRVFFILLICTLIQVSNVSAQEEPVDPPEPRVIQVATESFLADNEFEAITVSRKLDFLPHNDYEHPSNACGPLTARILYENKLLPSEIFPKQIFDSSMFWLATPDRLDLILKAPYYTKFVVNGPIWEVDFRQVHLAIGDFIYLEGGTFDHMLTISKIEESEEGVKVYSVTNYNTREGQVIGEVLLFDTADPTAGFFMTSYRNKNSWTGQTGLRKMHIYRPNPQYLVAYRSS